jgi:hypothetical protein
MADGTIPVIIFNPGVATGAAIVWTALSNIQPPQIGYAFTPTNNDTIPSHYTNIGGGYIYSYSPPVPPIMPNVSGFMNAVMSDPTISSAAQMGLAAWYPQLAMFVNQPTILDAGWQSLIQAYSSSWLTPTVQNSVETYARQYNIPLVP